jgi:hypothetical protein
VAFNLKAVDSAFQPWQSTSADASLEGLADELRALRTELENRRPNSKERVSIRAIRDAEAHAKVGDANRTFTALARASSWVLEVAKAIGVPVATEALKKSFGLQA